MMIFYFISDAFNVFKLFYNFTEVSVFYLMVGMGVGGLFNNLDGGVGPFLGIPLFGRGGGIMMNILIKLIYIYFAYINIKVN